MNDSATLSLRTTLPWPNIANQVGDYLRATWPELVNVPWLWFTGSSVWRFLYEEPQREGADLDLFVEPYNEARDFYGQPPPTPDMIAEINQTRLERVKQALAPIVIEPPQPKPKMTTSLGGEVIHTKRGTVDLWLGPSTPGHQLNNYPRESHGHCRAAYSFYMRSLLIIENQDATVQGELELLERQMERRLAKLDALNKSIKGAA